MNTQTLAKINMQIVQNNIKSNSIYLHILLSKMLNIRKSLKFLIEILSDKDNRYTLFIADKIQQKCIQKIYIFKSSS